MYSILLQRNWHETMGEGDHESVCRERQLLLAE